LSSTCSDEEDLLPHEFSGDPPAVELLDIADSPADPRVDEPPTDELPAGASMALPPTPQNSDSQDPSSDDEVTTRAETLCGQAEAVLMAILGQFGVENDPAGEAVKRSGLFVDTGPVREETSEVDPSQSAMFILGESL
jgi:hypothetical protein